jgi:hypothetical protein
MYVSSIQRLVGLQPCLCPFSALVGLQAKGIVPCPAIHLCLPSNGSAFSSVGEWLNAQWYRVNSQTALNDPYCPTERKGTANPLVWHRMNLFHANFSPFLWVNNG